MILRVAHGGIYAVGERAYIVAKRKIGADARHCYGHQNERVFRQRLAMYAAKHKFASADEDFRH